MSSDFHTNPQSICPLSSPDHLDVDQVAFPHSLFRAYLKALFSKKAGLKRDESVPLLGLQSHFTVDPQWLTEYLNICQWESSSAHQAIPLTVAQVYAAPLQTALLTHTHCPVPILGVVHAGNEMWSRLPLYVDTEYVLKVWFGETRWKAKGFEFDLHTTVSHPQTQEVHWLSLIHI